MALKEQDFSRAENGKLESGPSLMTTLAAQT
jgi:hypothetical protein